MLPKTMGMVRFLNGLLLGDVFAFVRLVDGSLRVGVLLSICLSVLTP